MYRIQAFNIVTEQFEILWTDCMDKRDKIIRDLLASGQYVRAGITFEWLPRRGRGV